MRAAGADHALDFAQSGRRFRRAQRSRLGTAQLDLVQKLRYRRPDGGPVRRLLVSRPDQSLAKTSPPRRLVELRQPGSPQQRPQRRVTQSGPVEFGEVRIAAGAVQEKGVADLIQ